MNDDWKISPPPAMKWEEPAKAEEAEVVAEPVKPVEEVKPEQPVVPTEWQGLPVRGSGDQIFVLKEGKRRWVTSPEAFAKMGFKFGDERKLDRETLILIPEGEPIR